MILNLMQSETTTYNKSSSKRSCNCTCNSCSKKTNAIKYFAKIPNIGSNPIARSPALLISKESIFEAVIIIHRETNPPMLIAIIKSL